MGRGAPMYLLCFVQLLSTYSKFLFTEPEGAVWWHHSLTVAPSLGRTVFSASSDLSRFASSTTSHSSSTFGVAPHSGTAQLRDSRVIISCVSEGVRGPQAICRCPKSAAKTKEPSSGATLTCALNFPPKAPGAMLIADSPQATKGPM